MYSRILTDMERKYLVKFIEKEGKKVIQVRKVVSGSKKYLPKIKEDLKLLERLLEVYAKP